MRAQFGEACYSQRSQVETVMRMHNSRLGTSFIARGDIWSTLPVDPPGAFNESMVPATGTTPIIARLDVYNDYGQW